MSRAPWGYAATALGLAFLALTVAVVVQDGVAGDEQVLRDLASLEQLERAARVLDLATGYVPMAVTAAVLAAALARVGRVRAAAFTVTAVWGALASNALLKRLVDRERPAMLPADADVSSLSFPSGHATATAALALVVVLVLPRSRRAAVAVAVLAVGIAGAAQLVLAQHHPSDVLAGWLWAGAWTTTLCVMFRTPLTAPAADV